MRKRKKISKAKTKNSKITMNYKVDLSEANAIRKKAKKFTKGNVTQLMRMAWRAFDPKTPLEGIRKSTRA